MRVTFVLKSCGEKKKISVDIVIKRIEEICELRKKEMRKTLKEKSEKTNRHQITVEEVGISEEITAK